MAKKEALLKIKELVEDFERNKAYHLSKEFLENHCEEQFVKPFLRALGWDIESRGIAPYLREVITQDRVTSRKTKRAPDYGFRLPGSDARLFFLEAKGAFVKLKTDKDAAQQARWYGRAGKTPITILFNFAEFAVYDCTQKQTSSSDAKFARIKYFTCDEFESNFDFIYDTFSREAIYNGNFQNFIKDKTQKKGNVTLDKDFVESLEKWRLKLAKSIATNNYKITSEELNHAVQLLLDRLIFLRFCEERDVEPFGQLQAVAKTAHIYKHLFDLFYAADQKYNSGLFHFQDGCITEKLKIEDKTLRDIIEELYPPKSDYSFYLMPVEILGNAYEQFLGKVIRITAGHNIKIEEKPEVRKAGGVYYTPQYIVDYIVENTVGKLIEGKTPKEIERIKIVDPACGSGSFLLGAFKYLLNYHQNYYYKKSPTSKELNPDGTLTTVEKRKILTNNIFGVDLDENAVEVSKLSLLLKCMEGETASSVKQQITLHHTRVLPDLDKNIVNGNSLVGFDFTENELNLDKVARQALEHKIKPFDWKVAFPNVFKQGGFDAVIGNPPYVKEYTDKTPFEIIKKSYLSKYYEGKMDLWYFFTCWGIDILKENGLLGYIAPNNWITNAGASIMRNKVLADSKIVDYIDFNNYKVFEDASIQTMIFVLEKNKPTKPYNLLYNKIIDKKATTIVLNEAIKTKRNKAVLIQIKTTINPKALNQLLSFNDSQITNVLDKIKSRANYYLKSEEVATGIDVHQDFVLDGHIEILKSNSIKKGDGIFNLSDKEKKSFNFNTEEKKIIKPFYTTSELHRFYGNPKNSLWVIYADKNVRQNITNYPNVKKHLDKFAQVITSDFGPYGLHRARDQKFFEGEKIISLRKTKIQTFTYTNFPCYVSQTYFVLKPNHVNLKYLTALLNSSLIYFWLYNKGKKQGEQLQIDKEPLLEVPLLVNIDKKKENLLEAYVNSISELIAEKIITTKTSEIDSLNNKIKSIENKIDQLVYELYELSPEEIQLIESANESH